MRPVDRTAALRRLLVLAAFGALILLPTSAAIGAVAALLAFSAARGASRLTRRRPSHGQVQNRQTTP